MTVRKHQIFIRQQGRCYYCDRLMTHYSQSKKKTPRLDAFTLDHFIPRSLGGTNGAGNLVGACRECNQDKGSMAGADYIKKMLGEMAA